MTSQIPAIERARNYIKGQILSGDWAIGMRLAPELELADECGVSRAAIREAIKQLEVLGWLRVEWGNGTWIQKPDFHCIEHTVEFLNKRGHLKFDHVAGLRRLIEIEVAGELARHCPHQVIEELYAINQRILDNRDSPAGYIEADVDFHDCLLRNAANPLYPMLMDGFREYLVWSRSLSYQGKPAVEQSARDHLAIIKAISEQNEDEARQLMAEHLGTVNKQTKENRKKTRRRK